MSTQRVGTCSICGGDVHGHRGIWMSVAPPPPDRCSSCGAVSGSGVIKMTPAPTQVATRHTYITSGTEF